MDSTFQQPSADEGLPSPLPRTEGLAAYIEPSPNPSTAHRIFIGPLGLRAGWSLLIYLIIATGVIFGIHFVSVAVRSARDHSAAVAAKAAGKPAPPVRPANAKPDPKIPAPMSGMIIGESLTFAGFLFLSWLMAVIEHRNLSVYGLGGLGRSQSIARFLVGAVWGFVALSLLVIALKSFHLLVFDLQLLHGLAILRWGATQLFAFLLVGLVEEYVFRGYLQFTLTRGMVSIGNLISRPHARSIAFWIASLFTSALFFLAHIGNGGENALGLFQVFLAGVVFVVALWRTGSLWWGIGFHMAWDWSQSFLYGVPDSGGLMQGRLFATHALGKPLFSGGADGPEGSLLCAPILILVITVLFYSRPSPQPPLEPELPSGPSHATNDTDSSVAIEPPAALA